MADKIKNSQISEIFRVMLDYLYNNENLFSIIIQPDTPASFMDYEKKVRASTVVFSEEQVGELARNFIHDEHVKTMIRQTNVAYEIFHDTNRLVHIAIMRTNTRLSLIITATKKMEDISKNFNFNLDCSNISGKTADSGVEHSTLKAQTLDGLMPQILKHKGMLVISGNNVYHNNIFGLQLLEKLNSVQAQTVGNNVQPLVVTTLESPIYAELSFTGGIIYRHQYQKDVYALKDVLLNNVLLSQSAVFYLNQPSLLNEDEQTKSLFVNIRNSKLCVIIEDSKTINAIAKEYYTGDKLMVLQVN